MLPSRAIGIIIKTSFLVKKIDMNTLSSQNVNAMSSYTRFQKWKVACEGSISPDEVKMKKLIHF